MSPHVGVVGASARAAVHSLARAGHSAWACDLFADRDLKRVADSALCPFDSYPQALPALTEQFPPGPVLYTGGLENHPHVVAKLAARRALWGNGPAVLEAVRDPFRLQAALRSHRVPALAPRGEPCPTSGRWLRKPLRSSAGHGIRFAASGEAASAGHYFQEFIGGTPMSAVFIEDVLLGVTEQLIGEPWLHAKPFAYCGSVGPVPVSSELIEIGIALHRAFGLRSVWNVDLVERDGGVYPIEVNPRYSASVEVIEHARGFACFLAPPSLSGKGAGGLGSFTIGKAIYYAPQRMVFPDDGTWDNDLARPFDPWRLPDFADIPEPGAIIEAGWPVLTLFAAGSSIADCRKLLQSRAAELDRLFAEARHDAQ